MRRLARLRSGAVLAFFAVVSCFLPTESLTTRDDVEALLVGPRSVYLSDGFVKVEGLFGWPQEELLGHDEQVFITLETDRGDRERVSLRRPDCTRRGVGYVACNEMLVQLRDGATVEQLQSLPVQQRVRVRRESGDAATAVGWAFGSWALASEALREHPAVAGVDHIRLDELQRPSTEGFTRFWLAGAIPTDRGSPQRHDGRLSIRRGEQINASYTNPSGSLVWGTNSVR